MGADQRVFQHGHRAEEFHVLECAGEAKTCPGLWRNAQQINAGEADLAALGAIEAAYAIDQARFTGAVWSNETRDAAGFHRQAHIVERVQAAEREAERPDGEQLSE